MRETKTTTLTFFVSISVLLEWLERQGKKGWYLEEIRGDGLTARFRRGEPGPVRCRAVPAQEKTLDRDTIEEYADFGWTYLGRFRELYHVFPPGTAPPGRSTPTGRASRKTSAGPSAGRRSGPPCSWRWACSTRSCG